MNAYNSYIIQVWMSEWAIELSDCVKQKRQKKTNGTREEKTTQRNANTYVNELYALCADWLKTNTLNQNVLEVI